MQDKHLALTQTALKLFINKGIHAVGINEILKESSIAKKTLYHHFASKDELIVSALTYRDKIFMHWLSETMHKEDTPQKAIYALFLALDDWFNDKAIELGSFHGCFFINAAAEYKESDSAINQCCKSHKNNVKSLVLSYVKQFIKDEAKALAIAENICILKEGAITTALVQNDRCAADKLLPLVSILIGNEINIF